MRDKLARRMLLVTAWFLTFLLHPSLQRAVLPEASEVDEIVASASMIRVGQLRELIPRFPQGSANPWCMTGYISNPTKNIINVGFYVCASGRINSPPSETPFSERSLSFQQQAVLPGERRHFILSFGPLKNFRTMKEMALTNPHYQLVTFTSQVPQSECDVNGVKAYGVDCPNVSSMTTHWGRLDSRQSTDFAYLTSGSVRVGSSKDLASMDLCTQETEALYMIGWTQFGSARTDRLRFTRGLEMRALIQFGQFGISEESGIRSIWTPYFFDEPEDDFPILLYLGRCRNTEDAQIPLEIGDPMLQILPSPVGPKASGDCDRAPTSDVMGTQR